MKKTKKFLFPNSFNASKPRISETVTISERIGGVLGSEKLNIPRINDEIAVIIKVLISV